MFMLLPFFPRILLDAPDPRGDTCEKLNAPVSGFFSGAGAAVRYFPGPLMKNRRCY